MTSGTEKFMKSDDGVINQVGAARSYIPPSIVRNGDGKVIAGLCVDFATIAGNRLIVAGWKISCRGIAVSVDRSTSLQSAARSHKRGDVASGYTVDPQDVDGFIVSAELRGSQPATVQISSARADGGEDRLVVEFHLGHAVAFAPMLALLEAHPEHSGLIFSSGLGNPDLIRKLLPLLPSARSDFMTARGFIEQARGIPEVGGIVVGWSISVPGSRVVLANEDGVVIGLDEAVRWHREDIVEAFNANFGNYALIAGMLQAWPGDMRVGGKIYLVALQADDAVVLSSAEWSAAPIEPVSFARWAFQLPTPMEQLPKRFERHDGQILEKLTANKLKARAAAKLEISEFGPQVAAPRCSVVVPLYSRFDFMLNQLLELSEDQRLVATTELIYVIDDPRLVTDVVLAASTLYEAYQVPFKLVWAGENRGFSGATNLGVGISKAPNVLLLNSDIIPLAPGWLDRMQEVLESDARIGIVGARLLFSNGALQHDGMDFRWEPAWGAYLNKHPRAGMMPDAAGSSAVVRQTAVTAACLLIRRATYDRVGGLDEGFLIGDFEDSDLCLKVRDLGLEVVLVRDVSIVHLERQSFSAIGTDSFRDRVARFNAWRHNNRWKSVIEALGAPEGERGRNS